MAEAAVSAPAPQAPAPSGGNNKMMFIMLGAMFFLLVAGMAGMFFFMKSSNKAEASSSAPAEHGGKKEEAPKNKGAALYVGFEPPFVVNFPADSPVRFLQVSVQVMTRDSGMEHELKQHDPAIRNALLSLFAMQKYDELSTSEGKETLRSKALDAVRGVIKDEVGEQDKVESVYFTSFVMQ